MLAAVAWVSCVHFAIIQTIAPSLCSTMFPRSRVPFKSPWCPAFLRREWRGGPVRRATHLRPARRSYREPGAGRRRGGLRGGAPRAVLQAAPRRLGGAHRGGLCAGGALLALRWRHGPRPARPAHLGARRGGGTPARPPAPPHQPGPGRRRNGRGCLAVCAPRGAASEHRGQGCRAGRVHLCPRGKPLPARCSA